VSLSWVAGTVAAYVSSTTQNVTTPAGIEDNDGVFALVFTRSTATPPAGWTLVTSGTASGGGPTQTLHIYRKDTVVAADSSTSYTWTQASSGRMGVAYAVVRATGGLVVVVQSSVATLNYAYVLGINAPVLTATAGSGELFIIAANTTVLFNSFTPTAPTGATLFTGNGTDDRLGGAYQVRSAGQSNSAYFNTNNSGDESGQIAITMRLRDGRTLTGWTDAGLILDDTGINGVLAEGVAVAPTVIGGNRTTAMASAPTDIQFSLDTQQALFARRAFDSMSAAVGAADVIAPAVYSYAVLQESTAIAHPLVVQSTYRRSLGEALQLLEQSASARHSTLMDSLGVSSPLVAVRTAQVLESLGLASLLITQARIGHTLATTIGLSAQVLRFFGLVGVEGVGVTSPLSGIPRYGRSATESIGVAASLTPALVLRAIAPEGLDITGSLALAWLANPVLHDGIVLDGAFLSPNEALVTWAMNTRNAAVSEYTQYSYTSFARRGTRYLGTSDTGLYVLDGDTDAGSPIIAHLRSGLLQMNGSKFAGFKAVYLGMHGTGETLFRVVAGSGETYTYRVVIQNMQSTKVRMGKGLRARYFAFELESLGPDFDLDTVEFIPLTAQRRV
jgi:hypothetical protein